MSRPKSDNFVGFKCPTELREDALELASLDGKTEQEEVRGSQASLLIGVGLALALVAAAVLWAYLDQVLR